MAVLETVPTARLVSNTDFDKACVAAGQALAIAAAVPPGETHQDESEVERLSTAGETVVKELISSRLAESQGGQSPTRVDTFCGSPNTTAQLCFEARSEEHFDDIECVTHVCDSDLDVEDAFPRGDRHSCTSGLSVREVIERFERHIERSLTCQGKDAVFILGPTTVSKMPQELR